MPAQDRDGAGVGERRVGQGLELGGEHVAFLVGQVQLVEALRDAEAIECPQLLDRAQRRMRLGQRVADTGDEPVPATLGDGVALLDRSGARLITDTPVRDLGVGSDRHLQAGPRDDRRGGNHDGLVNLAA